MACWALLRRESEFEHSLRPNRSGLALPLLKARQQTLPCSRRCSATPTVLGLPKNIAASGKSKIAEPVRYAFTRREASSRTMSGAFPASPAPSFMISLALGHQDLAG
ncbi:hypothetical protein EV131_12012 [Rhizobium laguerreae]|uniref:Uncharacterized protein n=1 Tax=Rhizobium laguerreae TaxID=1076926 RepID=A0AAX2QDF5_9HYPH|nr:hypothetical protein EV131_12012 [Rhizobium laguerreae]